MMEDVGISLHEKEGKQKDAYTKQKLIHNPISTSLFLSDMYLLLKILRAQLIPSSMFTQRNNKQRCRDGVMNEFLFWCGNPLVCVLIHEVTSLHPPSFHRNDFSTYST